MAAFSPGKPTDCEKLAEGCEERLWNVQRVYGRGKGDTWQLRRAHLERESASAPSSHHISSFLPFVSSLPIHTPRLGPSYHHAKCSRTRPSRRRRRIVCVGGHI